ncbi:MAG: COX15/CtaA family protein [Candidatus Kariarchaeaceae archaeon]|jgi:cytochrome c oxidase assembly protein subunit 15
MAGVSETYRRFTYLLVITTYILVLLGGYVKAIHAGLACIDWPDCNDSIIPDLSNSGIFWEFFHRVWAMFNGFFMIGIALKSWTYRASVPTLSNLCILGVVLYGTQVIFGGLTVTTKLEPIIVVAHLGNAVAIIMIQMSIAFIATLNVDKKL